jgi:hypothetical protein
MAPLALAIGIIGLIPVAYFVYSRLIRKSHRIDVEVGNVILTRVISRDERHNEKLAVVVCGLTLVNSAPAPVTPKDVILRYRFGRRLKANLDSIQTGMIGGKESMVMANASDRIVVVWHNLREALLQHRVLQQGETVSGSAIFFLDAPSDQYRQISGCVLHICDYSGRKSKHTLPIGAMWTSGIEKEIVLVDAPIREVDGTIIWEGIELTRR